MFFAAIAAFVVSLCLVSCNKQKDKAEGDDKEKTEATVEKEAADETLVEETDQPQVNFINALDKLVTIMEGTHIKSIDDVKALKEKADKIQEIVMVAQTEMQNEFRDKTEGELNGILKEMEEKTSKIIEKGEKETQRLKEEAKAAGISEEELEFLD